MNLQARVAGDPGFGGTREVRSEKQREHTHASARQEEQVVFRVRGSRLNGASPRLVWRARASMQLARTRYAGAKAFLYLTFLISPFSSGRVKREANAEMTTTLRWRRG